MSSLHCHLNATFDCHPVRIPMPSERGTTRSEHRRTTLATEPRDDITSLLVRRTVTPLREWIAAEAALSLGSDAIGVRRAATSCGPWRRGAGAKRWCRASWSGAGFGLAGCCGCGRRRSRRIGARASACRGRGSAAQRGDGRADFSYDERAGHIGPAAGGGRARRPSWSGSTPRLAASRARSS